MSVKIIQDRFDSYRCNSKQEIENAMAEISQEIALASLARSDFFKKAAFQGGTCLRIFHGMQRFSDDLDFLLFKPNSSFQLDPYLDRMVEEFRIYGVDFAVYDRSSVESAVKRAFLKSDSLGKILLIGNHGLDGGLKNVKIKFEVDTNPPMGSKMDTEYLDFPFPFAVTTQDLPSLFAGKSHALLCREYVKGRDWFDFVWYVGHQVPLNYSFLSSAIDQQGPWRGQGIDVTKGWYLREMEAKISTVDWHAAHRDVGRFLKESDLHMVQMWSLDYFQDRLAKLRAYL